jgi:hypothetical protein
VNSALRLAVPCLLAIAAICATAPDAHALGPLDIEFGARVGAATNPNSNTPTPLGIGVGGRAGVSIYHLYAGISAIHYFGSSADVSGPSTPAGTFGTSSVDYSTTLIGGELGYSITGIPVVTLRPQIGIGNASFSFGDASQSHLYVEPGLLALIRIGIVYVGADANILVIPSVDQGANDTKTYTSLTVHGQIGLVF